METVTYTITGSDYEGTYEIARETFEILQIALKHTGDCTAIVAVMELGMRCGDIKKIS